MPFSLDDESDAHLAVVIGRVRGLTSRPMLLSAARLSFMSRLEGQVVGLPELTSPLVKGH